MMNKKSEKANLENKKGIFFLIGLVVSLGAVLTAFEWKSPPKKAIDLGTVNYGDSDYIFIPPTPEKIKELPPQKIEVPFFDLVTDDSDIKEEFDLADTDPANEPLINFDDLVFKPNKNAVQDIQEEIPVFVEIMPEFPGGERALQKYLSSNVKYPVIAAENGIQGRVYLSFVINETGKISDVNIIRGVDQSLDNEALRVVRSMPDWKPGRQSGRAVKVRYNVPINFELQ